MTDNRLDQAGEARLYRALRRSWHPVMWADELADRPVAAKLLDVPLWVSIHYRRWLGEIAAAELAPVSAELEPA